MGAYIAIYGEVGGGCSYVRTIICCCGAGGPSVWVGDMSYVPTHWEESGRLPPQGGPSVYGLASKEEEGWDLGLTPTGVGNGQ